MYEFKTMPLKLDKTLDDGSSLIYVYVDVMSIFIQV